HPVVGTSSVAVRIVCHFLKSLHLHFLFDYSPIRMATYLSSVILTGLKMYPFGPFDFPDYGVEPECSVRIAEY
uniref:hypothetical protein n=1 Tax=Proteus mirabilis TaxID=584 RepID=UPI001C12E3F8